MSVRKRASRVWWVTLTMLALFAVGMFLVRGARAFKPLYLIAGVYFAVFQLLNFVYNATCGSYIFWERPRTWFFTDRLEEHKHRIRDASTPESQALALEYCGRLGKHDPGHCA